MHESYRETLAFCYHGILTELALADRRQADVKSKRDSQGE